jgi:hypothetical protein
MKPSEQEDPKVRLNRERRKAEEEGGTALDEIAWGVAEALNKEEIVKALAKYIEASAKQKKSAPWLGVAFSVFVFCGIGALGYLKVINSEATIGLLSAVLGVWYGQSARRS